MKKKTLSDVWVLAVSFTLSSLLETEHAIHFFSEHSTKAHITCIHHHTHAHNHICEHAADVNRGTTDASNLRKNIGLEFNKFIGFQNRGKL